MRPFSSATWRARGNLADWSTIFLTQTQPYFTRTRQQRRGSLWFEVPLSAGAHERVMGDDMDQTLRMALLSERLCKVLFYNVEWPSLGALPAVASCPPGEVPIHVRPRHVAPRHGGRQTGAVPTALLGANRSFRGRGSAFVSVSSCFSS